MTTVARSGGQRRPFRIARCVALLLPLFVVLGFACEAPVVAHPASSRQQWTCRSGNITELQKQRIRRLVAADRLRSKTPGISVGISLCDKVAFVAATGFADISRSLKAGPTVAYAIGSITKQFTAAAVLDLVATGRIRLDAKVDVYLPSAPHASEITVRELLGHTSGLPEYIDSPVMFTTTGPHDIEPETILAYVGAEPLDFAPGTRWQYSNSNYVVLGEIIRKVSGASYPDFVRSAVIAPGHLTNTYYTRVPLLPDHASGYATAGASPEEVVLAGYDFLYSAGALSSDVYDLLQWDHALCRGTIIPLSYVKQMFSPQRLLHGAVVPYGFGIDISKIDGALAYSHTGGIPGFSASNAIIPSRREAVVVLTNSYSTIAIELTSEIVHLLGPRPY